MADGSAHVSDEELHTLTEARARAEKLLDELQLRQAELDAAAPNLPADQLAAGRAAMQKAIESAQRMVQNLDKALQLVRGTLN
ncbi:MAG TPA: hypothetical protein VL403_11655 [Candidatus Kryptonia bacterium]|nr:hypothetical protein [Candidatus Kryptonia bacterium]